MEPTFLSKQQIFDVLVDAARAVFDSSVQHPEDMAAHMTYMIDGAAVTLTSLRDRQVVRWDQ